jgi:hypothetical protein
MAWFYRLFYKTNKMGKQTTNNITALNANQFKTGRKDLDVKKNPRYIYTEEDLGEGLLDAGVTSSYMTDQQDKLLTQPWITMLKARWA